MDWLLVLLAVAISSFGALQVFSSTYGTKWHSAWWKQLVFIGVGLGVMWLISRVDYRHLLGQVPILYAITVFLLLFVLVLGASVFGSRRWIPMPFGFSLQVSEFGKLVIILSVARYLTGLKKEHLEGSDLVKLGVLVGVPALLVFKEPDLGSSLTFLPALLIGVFLAGIRWKHVLILGLLAAVAPWFAYNFLMKDYQKARWESFLDPETHARDSGYQVIQSKIAIGSGQVWGRGITKGQQTQLRFLPVSQSDFIFATLAEEHGFVGVMVALGLYLLLLLQIVQNAQIAPDRAGMFICMGVASVLLFHLLVNVGMVAGLTPVTGIPLPLMSAGGSSMLSTFLMLGLVMNVRLRRL